MPLPDDSEARPAPPTGTFPPGVKAAGVIWIALSPLLGLLIISAITIRRINPIELGVPVIVTFGLLWSGVQTVRGRERNLLSKGAGSMLLGLLYAAAAIIAIVEWPVGASLISLITLAIAAGALVTGLVTAGVLAIAGRGKYMAWRKSQGLADRARQRTAEEDDYDDAARRASDRDETS